MKALNKPKNNKNKKINKKKKNHWLTQCYGIRTIRNAFQGQYQKTTLKYVETVAFSVAAGSFAVQQFNGNSVYDPNKTGTGGQPLGFDNMTPLFNKYRVDNYAFEVQMMSLSASYKGACVLINGNESPTTYDEVCEFNRCQQRGIGFNGSPTAVFTGRVLLSQLCGRSQENYHIDDGTGAINNTDPLEAIPFLVSIQNDNVSTIALQVTCTMWYDTIFYDPIIPVRSYTQPEKKRQPYIVTEKGPIILTPENIIKYRDIVASFPGLVNQIL